MGAEITYLIYSALQSSQLEVHFFLTGKPSKGNQSMLVMYKVLITLSV